MINFRPLGIFLFAVCLFSLGLTACNFGKSQKFSSTLYVRGTFNNWDLSAPMSAVPEGYVAQVQLPAGKNEIKIADESWQETDIGITPSQEIELDKPIAVIEKSGFGNNLIVYVTEDQSTHVFLLTVSEDGVVNLRVIKGKLQDG